MTTTNSTHVGPIEAVPMDFNGYVYVARQGALKPASEVRAGDVIVLAACVTTVTVVTTIETSRSGPILHFAGGYNIVRAPHELVIVIAGNSERGVPID